MATSTQECSGGNMVTTTQETSGGNMATTQENCGSSFGSTMNTVVKPVIQVLKPVGAAFIEIVKPFVGIGEKISDLETQTKTFRGIRDDVLEDIETGRRNGLVQTNEARTWLAKAGRAISDEKRNRERYEQRRKIFGCSPNCWLIFKVSKKADKMILEVEDCTGSRPEPDNLVTLPPPQPVELIPVDTTISLKASQDRIVKDALRYIKDDATVGLVGIWGPRQAGKTLLLKTINNSFRAWDPRSPSASTDTRDPTNPSTSEIVEDLTNTGTSDRGQTPFHFVIYVTASTNCTVKTIQSQILSRLKMQDNDSENSRATKIYDFLKDTSFLVLLDDLQNDLDLAAVGLPHPLGIVDGKLKRKVVITTRSQNLCYKMKANRDINAPGLQKDEALELFKGSAGGENVYSDPNIRAHMEDLVDIIRVLPTELMSFARDMRGKGHPRQWQDVIHVAKELIKIQDPEAKSLRERIVIKLMEDVKKLREKSNDVRDKIELAKGNGMVATDKAKTWLATADSIVSDGMAICESEQTEANWDISIAAAKLREIGEYISGRTSPSEIAAQPPSDCSRCLTKGHVMSECTAVVICDLCGLDEHVTEACPLQDGTKSKAEPCGFAVDGLGVYHIPYSGKQKAKMVIEEKIKSEECKYEIPKVWVQFRGLSEELMESPIIWAVGSILGVTCSIDMEFSKKHGRARLNVAVLDPNLIPDLVKVVIGDYVYKLQFRVENKEDAHRAKLIDMDTEPQEDDDDPEKEDQQEKENDINIGGSHTDEPSTQSASGSGSVPNKNKAKNSNAKNYSPKPKIDLHALPTRTSKWSALVNDQDSLEEAIKLKARVNLEDCEP